MADITDEATDQEMQERERNIQNHLAKPTLEANKECHNCGHVIERGLFCESYCAIDYDRVSWGKKNKVRE